MASKYELSKTYQYRKVMKPLLERKRRARINKCLDDLKDLMAECVQQQSGDPNAKLEKADILELTVQHLRTLKQQRQQKQSSSTVAVPPMATQQSFRSGYIQAANEVSRCLATLPKVDVALGTKLMTHLGMRLNQLESTDEPPQSAAPRNTSTPLSISCGATHTAPAMYSPVSSGYASDSDYARSSSGSPAPTGSADRQGLLQMAPIVWRPW